MLQSRAIHYFAHEQIPMRRCEAAFFHALFSENSFHSLNMFRTVENEIPSFDAIFATLLRVLCLLSKSMITRRNEQPCFFGAKRTGYTGYLLRHARFEQHDAYTRPKSSGGFQPDGTVFFRWKTEGAASFRVVVQVDALAEAVKTLDRVYKDIEEIGTSSQDLMAKLPSSPPRGDSSCKPRQLP
jgi:hypothetical protein